MTMQVTITNNCAKRTLQVKKYDTFTTRSEGIDTEYTNEYIYKVTPHSHVIVYLHSTSRIELEEIQE